MAKNSWWWTERLPKTCRVVIPIKLESSASLGFIHEGTGISYQLNNAGTLCRYFCHWCNEMWTIGVNAIFLRNIMTREELHDLSTCWQRSCAICDVTFLKQKSYYSWNDNSLCYKFIFSVKLMWLGNLWLLITVKLYASGMYYVYLHILVIWPLHSLRFSGKDLHRTCSTVCS
jgi:hypothetical protein